jgi:eukaryotic-like serine/threonine-protein kinase
MFPYDVAPDGRVLAATIEHRWRLFYRGEAASPERELSAQGESVVGAISPDGSWVAFLDDSVNGVTQCYLRSASGAPPVSLGPGIPMGFAPDGRTLVVVRPEVPAVVLHPIGPGQATTIRLDGFEIGSLFRAAGLLPDGKAIWFRGNQPSRPPRTWEVAVSGGKPRPLTTEGVNGWVTADGASVVFSRDSKQWIQPIAGGEVRPVGGLLEDEYAAAWTADGKPLFVSRYDECPAKVYRLDPKTGRREFVREIGPSDSTGVQGVFAMMTPDGKACAYMVTQWLTELHMIEGLR